MHIDEDETYYGLKEIEKNGSNLEEPLTLDFFISVPTEEIGKLVIKQISKEKINFTKMTVEKDHNYDNWTCYCSITMIPKLKDVLNIEN